MKAWIALLLGAGALFVLWLALHAQPAAREPARAERSLQQRAAEVSLTSQQPSAASAPGPVPSVQRAARPLATLRLDYEREPRDAGAAAAEQQIRAIYAPRDGILREVRCSESVCKLEARWSRSFHAAYNAALLELITAFSKELSIEPAGPPDGALLPVTIYVRRPHAF